MQTLQNEKWKYIDKFQDYMISNLGRVYSTKSDKILSQNINNSGYSRVSLKHLKNGVNLLGKRQHLVHLLVVMAFGDKNGKKYQENLDIDHVNRDKQCNAVENLELVSHSENIKRIFQNKNAVDDIF